MYGDSSVSLLFVCISVLVSVSLGLSVCLSVSVFLSLSAAGSVSSLKERVRSGGLRSILELGVTPSHISVAQADSEGEEVLHVHTVLCDFPVHQENFRERERERGEEREREGESSREREGERKREMEKERRRGRRRGMEGGGGREGKREREMLLYIHLLYSLTFQYILDQKMLP